MAPGPGGGDGCASRARTDILSHPRTGGVLEMLARSLAVQKAAGLLSPVMPEPAGTRGPAAYGAVPPARQDPDMAGKPQLATREGPPHFLEIHC